MPRTPQDFALAGEEFTRLLTIMDALRSPGGCPWDAEQTHESLVRYLIEEAYEVVEAIEAPGGVDRQLLKEELGDVLLQVVFHARVAEETPVSAGGFEIAQVLKGLNDKLERRHPHVFSSGDDAVTAGDVEARWEELKRKEKPERTGVFDGVPPHLPALALTEKVLSKAQKNGVSVEDLQAGFPVESAEERLGAELFAVVQRAKSQGLDAEKALRAYTRQLVASFEVKTNK